MLYVDDGLLDLWNVRYLMDPAQFGTLYSYKGVSFLPQQALVHAPAASALSEQIVYIFFTIISLTFIGGWFGGKLFPPVLSIPKKSSPCRQNGTILAAF